HYLKSNNSSIEEDEDFLIEKAQETIPQTVQVIKKMKADISIGKYKDSFLGLLSLPDIYINETGKCCVLIFDEFQNLEEILGEHVFQDLGKKIMTQKKCFYIFASSYKTVAERILSEKLSLLFGNFEIVSLGAFDLKTSQEFIEHHLQDVLAGAQLRHFLTDFTGGHPLYLNLICKELVNLSAVYKQNEIYMPLLSQAVENTIFNRWGVISRHFELIVLDLCQGKDNRVVSSLLISLANGKNKIDDIIADVAFSKLKVRSKIKDLLEKSILVKNGQHYYFQDKLFKYWVRYVYQKRLHDVDLSQEKQKKEFKEEFARSMDAIRISAGQDFSARIVDLLHCFDDESFDLNGRKYRLPVFEEVTSFKLKNDNGTFLDVIKAIGNNETWLIALKKENVGEGDIQTALSYAK
ncbi:MAG TPA: hypothetical protein PKH98_06125, partial [Candidatus Omnitrophota bacterium]|nr:hypothetical protein [Candidatus Omnitrophota bacterium]